MSVRRRFPGLGGDLTFTLYTLERADCSADFNRSRTMSHLFSENKFWKIDMGIQYFSQIGLEYATAGLKITLV